MRFVENTASPGGGGFAGLAYPVARPIAQKQRAANQTAALFCLFFLIGDDVVFFFGHNGLPYQNGQQMVSRMNVSNCRQSWRFFDPESEQEFLSCLSGDSCRQDVFNGLTP
ncbi:MAG: hypothetical protein HWE08_09085 [Alphaproteobacteria bacterium]|nr:hypothetical protein [Alphaproteobacteria bacterium]